MNVNWVDRIWYPEKNMEQPLNWKKSKRILIEMVAGDFFDNHISEAFIDDVLEVIEACVYPSHAFMVRTKYPENIQAKLYQPTVLAPIRELGGGDYIPDLWLGVVVRNQEEADKRIPILLQVPVAARFVLVEPLLGPVDILPYVDQWKCPECGDWVQDDRFCDTCGQDRWDTEAQTRGINWVICGSETGPDARPCHPDWIRSLRDQCQTAGTPFFLKGMGEFQLITLTEPLDVRSKKTGDFETWPVGKEVFKRVGHKVTGRLLDGIEYSEFPTGEPSRKN